MEEEREEKIRKVIYDLLKEEDVLACMVARRGMQGIIPPPDHLKIKDTSVWRLLQETMENFFAIISQFSQKGLTKIWFELGNYEVGFFVVTGDAALIVIIPALANRGLLEVEMENGRRTIRKIIGL